MTGQGAQPSRAERTIRAFLSSTFIDMQAEREELIKRVFPRIASLCRQRHIAFTEVDLRWGITGEQQQEGKVLSICLDEIDRCRPYFIGMLGSRYGYVPPQYPPGFSERFPDLAKDTGRSVTELEITYGVLANPTLMSRSLFLIRRADAVPLRADTAALVEAPTPQEIAEMGLDVARQRAAERTGRLENLKQRIRATGLPVVDGYSSAQELGEHVLEFLTNAIDQEYPEEDIPDVFDREDAAQAALLRSHAHAYFRDGRIEQSLGRFDETFVLTGEPGSGKTALLANWVAGRQATPADAEVPRVRRSRGRGASAASPALVFAFVGASSESTNWRFILRYLTRSLVRRFRLSTEVPEDGIELIDVFRDCLTRAASIHPVILVIDGLDHLWADDGAHSLFWLPKRIPKNVRLILSAAPGEVVVEAESRGWSTVRVPTLRRQQRAAIVRAKLHAYGKTLDESIVTEIAATEGGRSPAFVHILLNEMRLHGDHRSLVPLIRRYLTVKTDRELLALMLERWERDYEEGRPALVSETFSLLWASPGGLTEIELADLLDRETEPVPRILLATLLRAAGDLLAERTGRVSIAYRALRDAVSERYLGDEDTRAQARLRIARHFAARDYGLRRAEGGAGRSWHSDVMELADLYSSAGAWSELAELLGDGTFLSVACLSNRLVVARHWAAIETNSPIRMLDTYRQAIDTPNIFHSARDLALLLRARDYRQESLKVFDALIERYRLPNAQFMRAGGGFSYRFGKFGSAGFAGASAEWMQQQTLQELLFDRCTQLIEIAEFEAALADLAEAERIADRWGDLPSLAKCKTHGATIAELQGDRGRAAQMLQEAIAIAREADAADILADATSQAGRILFEQSRPGEARKLQEDAIAFCQPRESARALGLLHNNLGLICASLGQIKKALKNQEECERWYRRLEADAPAEHVGRALGNQAELLEQLNRPEKAKSCYREAAKWFAKADNPELEQVALTQLAIHLGKALNKPPLSGRRYDQTQEEAASVMLRLYRLRSADIETSAESIAEAARNAAAVLFHRAFRLRELGQLDEAHQRLSQSIAVARAHGIEYLEQAAVALDEELQEQKPPDETVLACVHCGRTDDPSLHLREYQFAPRNRGRQYFFAQCTSCRERFAGTGYHVLLTLVGGYPEAQLRRALAPGSDELWIA